MSNINLLLVDDEELIRERLMKAFQLKNSGYEIVAQASNGAEALLLCETINVDIVIADIVMPVMDGLVLTQEVAKRFPHIKVLLLSCHDDFDYVREALRYGAADYLLKTDIDFDHLLTALDKIRQTLQKKMLPLPQDFSEKNWACLFQEETIENRCQLQNAFVQGERFGVQCVLFKVLGYGALSERMSKSALNELKEKAVGLICKYDFLQASCVPLRSQEAYFGVLLNFPSLLFPPTQQVLRKDLSFVIDQIKQELRIACVCVCSPFLDEIGLAPVIQRLQVQANRTKDGFSEFFYHPEQKLVFQEKETMHFLPILGNIEVKLRADFQRLQKSATQEAIRRELLTIEQNAYCNCLHPIALIQFVFSLHKEMRENERNYNDEVAVGVNRIESIYDLNEFILQYLLVRQTEQSLSYASNNPYVKKVLCYMQENFMQTITMESLSAEFHLSPNYLSHLFKKELKIGIIACLNKMRMEQASVLLRSTEYSLQEISSMVGINDYKYFLKLFKTITGETPNEYRKIKWHSGG